jgi:hypothetical protein
MQIALQVEHDPFSEASQPDDASAPGFRERRFDRTKEKRAREPDRDERPAENARLEGDEIRGDIRQLGHFVRENTKLS